MRKTKTASKTLLALLVAILMLSALATSASAQMNTDLYSVLQISPTRMEKNNFNMLFSNNVGDVRSFVIKPEYAHSMECVLTVFKWENGSWQFVLSDYAYTESDPIVFSHQFDAVLGVRYKAELTVTAYMEFDAETEQYTIEKVC